MDNSNGLYIDYYQKPILQYCPKNGNVWSDLASYGSMDFTQTTDGSLDRITYSWQQMYGLMDPNNKYRLVFRYQLRGDNWQQYSLSFNGYFNLARNLSSDVTYSAISLKSSTATSQFIGGGSQSFHSDVQPLGSLIGYHYNFRSFDDLIEDVSFSNNFDDLRHSVYVNFEITEQLSTIQFSITDFSTDLFFEAPSDKEFQDYDNAEQEILDSTLTGRNEASSLFGGFGSLATYVSTPILAVGNIMGEFFSEIDILNTILRFSLSLGIFSFLVGMAVAIGGHISKSARSEARNNKK